jgi:isoquinoline 1-oxidoreductase subunit beta
MTKIKNSDAATDLSRRHFLVGTAATGLVFGYATGASVSDAAAAVPVAPANFAPSVWYSIGRTGKVTVTVGKADMGQHIASTMAQLVAEELGSSWKDMAIAFASNDAKYNDPVLGAQITGGSWSTGMNFDTMCRAGAAGRITLIKAGADMMGVPEAECKAGGSRVTHGKSKKSVTYAAIVASGKANKSWTPDELKAIKLKTPDQYVLIGKSVPQLDIPSKTNGTAKYGIDTFLPGMVYGKLALPPVRYGAKVTAVDDTAAKAVPGFIKAVTIDDKTGTTSGWVVAVATTYAAAKKAADALKITWDKGPNAAVSTASIIAEAQRLQKEGTTGIMFVKNGDSAAALGSAAKVLEAEYITNIAIHAPLEPMNATVEEKAGVWHIYTGNQFATRTTGVAAAALGVDASKIVMHQSYLGGGFGRRLEADMVIPALLASKAVGKPVKLIYSREDDMAMDFTRPLTVQKVKVGLDASGKAIAMEHDVVSAWPTEKWGIPAFMAPAVDKKGVHDGFTVNGADYWYTMPNHTVRNFKNGLAQSATPSGQMRAVAPSWTFWAIEGMMDEMAIAAGKDPVDYRLALLDGAGENAGGKIPQTAGGAKRLANALRTAVGRSGYGATKLGPDEGMGVACVSSQERNSPTWTACVAHVAVNRATGAVKVKKLTLAMDVGTAINPDGVRAQIEGSANWGTSLALHEGATMKNGAIEQTNFDGYMSMRMEDAPEIDISIISNGDAPVGCGEPGVTVVGPAIANAIFKAVGARVRTLPMASAAIKAAIKA